MFEIVEKPNQWDRRVRNETRAASGTSELGNRRADFWANYSKLHPDDFRLRNGFRGANVRLPVESAGLTIVLYLAKGGVGIYVGGKAGEDENEVFARVQSFENRFAERAGRELGEPGDWHCLLNSPRADMADPANWQAAADWLHESLALYREILSRTDGQEE